MPVFSAVGFPPFGWRMTRTEGRPSASTMFAVLSVEPSSTTMISTGCVDAAIDRTAASIPAASL